jgi:hypothetical protein
VVKASHPIFPVVHVYIYIYVCIYIYIYIYVYIYVYITSSAPSLSLTFILILNMQILIMVRQHYPLHIGLLQHTSNIAIVRLPSSTLYVIFYLLERLHVVYTEQSTLSLALQDTSSNNIYDHAIDLMNQLKRTSATALSVSSRVRELDEGQRRMKRIIHYIDNQLNTQVPFCVFCDLHVYNDM